MKRSYTKAMSSAMVMSLVLTAALPTTLVRAASGEITRVGEADSYATAAKVATLNWSNPKDVVLVCGEGYADAVSATVLAKQLDAPILLTTASSLNNSTKDALDKLKPENIYIIGGNASVSKVIRDGLKNSKYSLIELSGKDRYETNIAVANQLVKLGIDPSNVILVSGEGFSDTLSVTSVAAAKDQILLLGTNNKNSMKPVLEFVKSNNSKVTVVGTTYSVSEDMYNQLGAVKRINGGEDRFDTNLRVLDEFGSDLNSEKLFISNATGERYADALIASSLAGKWNSPLVLVDSENSSATNNAMNYIKRNINNSTDLNVIGNLEAVSNEIEAKINSSIPKVDSPTVKSVTSNGLNQVKVVFNTDVDEDTSELIKNYQIDGSDINTISSATATLQDDYRTVLITFTKSFAQSKDVNFTVKNTVLNKDLTKSISKYEEKITFLDLAAPTVESVTTSGGNKLILKFSEPVRMNMSDLSSMKINRQSIDSYGFNISHSVLHDKSDVWSDKAEIYFDSPLPEGTNTFTIPNGERGRRFDDAAGFSVKGTSVKFTVNSVEGKPRITTVSGESSGTVYITYDRAMDKETALKDTNYKINGTTVYVSSSDIKFEEGSNDKIVKIRGISHLIKTGENEVTIRDDVEDTYGNEISETKMKFTLGEDTVKPQVTNVTLVDSKTLRVKFSKDVANSYATSRSNYKLVDEDGTDITYKIDDIDAVFIDGNSKRTYDIKFKDKDALRGSKYELTIKNIIDTNSKANVMDTYTTSVYGLDDQEPNVTEIVKKADEDRSAVVFFNKVMDEDTLINPDNYRFMDGNGDGKKLPSSAILTPGVDGKSIIIEFPSGYILGDGTGERRVVKISVANVKDKNGQSLESGTYSGTISTSSGSGPSIVDDTSRLTYDGNNIKVRFSLNAPLDLLNINDFRVNGQKPDSGTMIGNDIILTFRDDEKVENIRNAGSSTTLTVYNSSSVDTAGRKIQSGSDRLYLPPVTVPESWRADSNRVSGSNATVTIAFNQEIDDDIQTSYYDDFIFVNETTGQKLNVLAVSVDRRNVVFKFNNGFITAGDKITVRANPEILNINVRGNEHSDDNYAVYSPTSDDLGVRTLIAH